MGALIGCQDPSFLAKPRKQFHDLADAEDSLDLAAAFGLVADPWQEGIVTAALARGAAGELVSRIVAVSVPRQNGKNGAIEILELGQMVLLGRRILHTAHEVKTGRKAFLRLLEFFESQPALGQMVKQIRRVNGQEAIFLTNGASCEFIARSKSSGRGFSVDTLVMDEAQELSEEGLAALLPTVSASSEPQQIVTGTPPAPTDAHGEVFRRLHDSGHDGSDPSLFWAEWSAVSKPGELDIDPDDEALWFKANPALGKRITIDAVRAERVAMDDATFRRERLGLWEQERTARVLPLEDWQACADANIRDDGQPVAIGIDIAPGRDAASIAACGLTVEGRPWLDVIENRRGTPNWLVPRLNAILEKQPARAVLIDVLSPAGSLIEPLEAEGIKVSRIGSNIMAAAAGQLFDAVMSHDLRHLDQASLNLAAAAARKRKLGDAWAWNRSNEDADITPLVAATMALTGRTYGRAKRPVTPKRAERKVIVW
ncbi:terminase TerL endonuclease subunit [uncultured Corynebacterium sp.]|uniref:terminase TerL endonuclease subunit n=1 Tax=uncultured Corynebacterium sp. TaxID=159447 RepID=UPI0025970BC0|nr:terminase TerL endonuclease subunit [uncultured Corynebacterium sp.]